jgi:hypothetical protein
MLSRSSEITRLRQRYAMAKADRRRLTCALVGERLARLMKEQLDAENAMPDIPDHTEPCFQRNPTLWARFCDETNRPNVPSMVWTEADVIQWLDARGG